MVLIGVVAISVLGRVVWAHPENADSTSHSGQPHDATGLVSRRAADEPEAQPEPGPLVNLLPYLTEGGISMLLGIAVGVAARTAMRWVLILFAIFFVLLQVLAYQDIVTIDWGAFANTLHDFVLNISEDTGLGAIVKHKLPSAAAFMMGWYLGLKKG